MKPPRQFYRIFAGSVIACAFILTVYRAKVQPIAHDEALAYEWYLDGGIYHALMFDPSNHVLFTLLAKVITKIFGVTELSLRGASLVGAAAYLSSAYCLCAKLFEEGPSLPLAVALLTWNPQILDFMVAARGYILGLACLMWALYFLSRALERGRFDPESEHWRRDCVFASALLALSVVANLAYLFPAASLAVVFSILALHGLQGFKQITSKTLHAFARYFIAPGTAVGLFFLWPFLIQVRPWQFKRSLHWASDALRDFFESSFLYKWTGDIYAPSLGALPPTPGSWQKTMSDLGIYVFLPLLFLFLLLTITLVSRASPAGREKQIVHCQMFVGAAVASIGLTFFLHVIFRVDYPMSRFCLYLIPLLTLGAALAFRELSVHFVRLPLRTLGTVVAALVLSDYALSLNTKYFRYNAYDVFSRDLFFSIADDARAHGLIGLRVGGTWWYEPEINFYIRRYHATWIKPYDVQDKSYFWESPGALEPADYNYYLFTPSNDPKLTGPRVRTVFQDLTTGLKAIAIDK